MKTVRIGSGAGYSGDRIEPAIELAERGDIAYLGFECLAERTIALAQQARLADPDAGYDPLLGARMEAVLAACVARGIRIITNMGAANPHAAAAEVARIARRLGLPGIKIAAVTGDDVLSRIAAAPHRADGTARRDHRGAGRADRLGQRLSRDRADRARAGRRRRCGDHRTGRRSGAVHGPAGARVRLADGRLGRARPGHRDRPSAGMRGPDHRRVFRRPRLQGRGGPRAPRLSAGRGQPPTGRR